MTTDAKPNHCPIRIGDRVTTTYLHVCDDGTEGFQQFYVAGAILVVDDIDAPTAPGLPWRLHGKVENKEVLPPVALAAIAGWPEHEWCCVDIDPDVEGGWDGAVKALANPPGAPACLPCGGTTDTHLGDCPNLPSTPGGGS